MTGIRRVAALPDGGAFVINYVISNVTHQVWRVNVRGQVIQHVYQCVRCDLTGLLVLNNNLYVIHDNGTLLEININNTNTVQVYQVPDVIWMFNYGSLSYHPSVITHPDLLLLADVIKGEIFSYNVTSKNKQVHLTGLSYPKHRRVQRGGSGGPDPPLFLDPPLFICDPPLQPNPISQTNVM